MKGSRRNIIAQIFRRLPPLTSNNYSTRPESNSARSILLVLSVAFPLVVSGGFGSYSDRA
jgi:hypothetical protein